VFAAAAGARAGVTVPRRVLDVTRIPPGRIVGLRESAARAAAGYALVTWTGEIPDEYLGGVAYVHEAMNDAPSDFEAVRWDAERVRDVINRRVGRSGDRYYSVAAVHGATGQMAALTALSVAPEVPEWGLQNVTAVARPHRGYRLGMLVKAAMTEWLATAEPDMRMIQTANASANTHMIAINDQLGYELLQPSWQDGDGRARRHAPDFFARRAGAIDPVLRANVRWLSRYRHPRCLREPAASTLLEAFADRRPLLAGAVLAGDPVLVLPVAYHLLWRRELTCDLSVLLSGTSTTCRAEG
jgi:hypothetical protein